MRTVAKIAADNFFLQICINITLLCLCILLTKTHTLKLRNDQVNFSCWNLVICHFYALVHIEWRLRRVKVNKELTMTMPKKFILEIMTRKMFPFSKIALISHLTKLEFFPQKGYSILDTRYNICI